jgi:hypothetical protein
MLQYRELFYELVVVPGDEHERVTGTRPASGASETAAAPAPAADAPVTEAPAADAPVAEAPVTEAPVTEAPVTGAPAQPAVTPETPAEPGGPAVTTPGDAVTGDAASPQRSRRG